MERFDGGDAWNRLTPATQAAIGAIALELAVTWRGHELQRSGAARRALWHASGTLVEMLGNQVAEALPDVIGDGKPLRIPSVLGDVCRACGCSETDTCGDDASEACSWAEPGLGSTCAASGVATCTR